MLFNSYAFLFLFLPLALAGYQVAGRLGRRAVVLWLGAASLAFYAWWRPAYVVVLLASVAINYLASCLISRRLPNAVDTRVWLWGAIAANLGALAYFKYLFPLLGFAAQLSGSPRHWTNVLLPLGISFFTFTQIAYLVDLQQGAATQEDLPNYLLFVTFFPHLIAGPILHHGEMMPQFKREASYQLHADDFAVGATWFIMGLGKKVLLADSLAATANTVYALHGPLAATLAWRGVLAYALQLYFDFSGYSDMALGLARMFSIDFPLNFASPYKATSIIDYWQRWHITLTRYVTAYLYNPLQLWIADGRIARGLKVTRKALATPGGFAQMLVVPMLLTFLITGIWHGAGLKYIVFGLLHGAYLTINHAWRIFRSKAEAPSRLRHAASVALTFLSVIAAQTFFRGDDCRQALGVLAGMAGLHRAGPAHLPGESTAALAGDLLLTSSGLIIVWCLPNTQQILARFKPALALTQWDERPTRILWSPRIAWAIPASIVFFLSLVYLQNPSAFLYFQF